MRIAEVIRALRENGTLRGIPGRGVYVLRLPAGGDA